MTPDLTPAITAFRELQAKDSITPENLGSLLQALADLSAKIEERIDIANSQIDILRTTLAKFKPPISCHIERDTLRVTGHEPYLAAGYVPYIFRSTKKRNRFALTGYTKEQCQAHGPCPLRKGWNVYGSHHALRIIDSTIHFTTAGHAGLTSTKAIGDSPYSPKPDAFVPIRSTVDYPDDYYVAWGRSKVSLTTLDGLERLLRFRFAIGFGLPPVKATQRITPSDLVSPLAEFNVTYDPQHKKMVFTRPI